MNKIRISKVICVVLVALLAINMIGSREVSASINGGVWIKNGKQLVIAEEYGDGVIYSKHGDVLCTLEFEAQAGPKTLWVSAYGFDREFGLEGSAAMKMTIKKRKIIFKYNDGSYDIAKRIKGIWKLKNLY